MRGEPAKAAYRINPTRAPQVILIDPPTGEGRAGTWVGGKHNGCRLRLQASQWQVALGDIPIRGGWSSGLRVAIFNYSGASASSSPTGSPGHEIAIVSTRRVEPHARPRRIRGGLRLHGRARRCHRGWQGTRADRKSTRLNSSH